ncbi:bifunctional 2-polyprenyl-6-hydroxyphenol methylase/3-demethylubiquinol 3-O-methyltransferase UbiG [Methylotuvimicrobium alcaliphilum]|uniref:Ubiquinone biosynthesis O-methyltransferase n=1 Tax=Methylotuvimicrobium alcaliphilum (strain DSM 19304 / NCIMB 14124 / VKM B-2133 / 20Z) TaxID=1091494 RepID=G4SYJ8_META2|nr:bifunctional 2-polyprenyl-6-hydroxyphenol methylase/3-demethylubiquinol 3-O-methyltransferase UbiG [Methylotuvimicrobium alcaliphilum]CCE23184.1 3-demethylubiquinone-9 3-methyltransferase (3,4-dihydroxy-5-hexaprenylbenzoate methyltransferase) (DHHB methyltransferase) [Methylotuvimicrobium alcaliphilum 20Z]
MTVTDNVHLHEINKFGSLAERWWDTSGEFKTLHDINPLRIRFIQEHAEINGKRIVDVGCGGGILSEGLAKNGADMLGIDLSEELIDIADLHGLESGINAHYRKISAEALADEQPEGFDHVTCMEMLEHVPDPASIVRACAKLVKPGGTVFFSTLNRKPKAYLLAIVAAEYVLRMLPKGTHDFKTFIKPSELSRWARETGLELQSMAGIEYNPLTKRFSLGKDIDVNYLAAFKRVD